MFGPKDLRQTIFACQATDSIPPQVSRKARLALGLKLSKPLWLQLCKKQEPKKVTHMTNACAKKVVK